MGGNGGDKAAAAAAAASVTADHDKKKDNLEEEESEEGTAQYSDFILTRYLYVYDEVGLSFVESLLSHKPIEETLFWISELYHSGFHQKSWDLLWFIYLDFYFVTYPGFIKYLSQKHRSFTFTALLSVVYNLNAFKLITPFVFLLRLIACNQTLLKSAVQESVYKGRKPTWLSEKFTHTSMHHFIRDLHTHRFESMGCHTIPGIDSWTTNSDDVAVQFLTTLQTYYQVDPSVMESFSNMLHESLSFSHDDNNLEQEEKEQNLEEEMKSSERNEHDVDVAEEMTYRPYNNYRHVLFAIVCLFEFSMSSSSKNKSEEIIPDILPHKEEEEEEEEKEKEKVHEKETHKDNIGSPYAHRRYFEYTQFLDKEYKIPTSTPAWSPKYIQKYYKNHTFMKWTPETFTKRIIYLGIPSTMVAQFEVDQPETASSGTFPSYTVSDNIMPFYLSRKAFDYDIINLWRQNWLYFASRSPLWYSRLSEYEYVISHDDQKVDILSDEHIEAFHSAFPYDPDETGEDVVDKIIPKLFQEYTIIDWLNIVFPNHKICENCPGNSRFAVYLKYHIHTLFQHDHVWF